MVIYFKCTVRDKLKEEVFYTRFKLEGCALKRHNPIGGFPKWAFAAYIEITDKDSLGQACQMQENSRIAIKELINSHRWEVVEIQSYVKE